VTIEETMGKSAPTFFIPYLLVTPLLAAGATVVLVENSKPTSAIVAVSEDRPAAEELARCVQKATGARLPIVNSPAGIAKSQVRILVGRAVAAPEILASLQKLRPDSVVIHVDENAVTLAGNPAQGTEFAVYTFLEKMMGVRWLWPGELGEIVPRMKSLRLETGSFQQEPAFSVRRAGSLSESAAREPKQGPDQWAAYQHKIGVVFDEQALALARLWAKHNRFGGPAVHGGHAFGAMAPPAKYGEGHPEYYALVNGKRLWQNYDGKHGAQLCTTNPDVVRIVTEYCNRTFDEHPDWEAISISPNDGGGFCECEQCRKLDTGTYQVVGADPEAGGGKIRVITDRMMTFANQVTEGVVRKHPDKKLSILAYSAYREPPVRVKIHPSLNIQYHLRANMHWNPEAARKEYAAIEGWSRAATNLGVTEFLIQGALADMPRLFVEPMARSIRRIHELHYQQYGTQAGEGFATNGLNYYALGKLLWEPARDEREILREYVEKGFGPGAAAMNRYYEGLMNRWKESGSKGLDLDDCRLKTYEGLAALYPPEFRSARHAEIDEARRLTSGDDRKRVEFIAQALRYMDVTLAAVEKSLPLLRSGWELGPKSVTAPKDPDMRAFRAALAAWEEREAFIAAQKNTLVLSYRWTRYNDYLRAFNPLWRMREFVKSFKS
jgi:uncharacterized protein DUF4838